MGFTEMVLGNCAQLLGSQERFAQTAVGWVLRKLGRSDKGCVAGFVEAKLVAFFRRISRAVAAVAVGGEHICGSCHRQVRSASDGAAK
jgi:3-methyladenine DNA glycosylase AlkD